MPAKTTIVPSIEGALTANHQFHILFLLVSASNKIFKQKSIDQSLISIDLWFQNFGVEIHLGATRFATHDMHCTVLHHVCFQCWFCFVAELLWFSPLVRKAKDCCAKQKNLPHAENEKKMRVDDHCARIDGSPLLHACTAACFVWSKTLRLSMTDCKQVLFCNMLCT